MEWFLGGGAIIGLRFAKMRRNGFPGPSRFRRLKATHRWVFPRTLVSHSLGLRVLPRSARRFSRNSAELNFANVPLELGLSGPLLLRRGGRFTALHGRISAGVFTLPPLLSTRARTTFSAIFAGVRDSVALPLLRRRVAVALRV